MLKFKVDILATLKEHGFSTYALRQKTSIGQKTIHDMKNGIVPGIKSIDIICTLLNCQLSDIIEHVPDSEIIKK